ncbi:hypothetical protein, partial [Priestia megaterium]|uniref:hypothetical protein n=1 Tax=Priestia megaterium TaxID=1404 RepID=UPI001BEAC13F
SNMPKRASFFTEEQLEIFKSASKGISFKIPNLPKTISFFTPAQQEVLKSVGKGLNLGLDRLPKTASIFTTEQQQILKSTGELLSLKINNMPKTASYFNPAQRSMLKSIAAGLNISNYTKVAPSITVDDFIPYWEDEEVQETIRQEIYDLEGIESEKSLKDRFNNWARTLIDLHSTFLERAPAAYLLLLLLVWVAGLTVKPAVEDLIKEKVWHLSDYLEDTKEEPIRKQTKAFKTSIIMDQEVSAEISYADAERSMRHVRITNRETSVFRSEQRSSGRIDTIQSNKPVIILHKKKNWSLVLYQDNHNQEVEGWVFTKNLIK